MNFLNGCKQLRRKIQLELDGLPIGISRTVLYLGAILDIAWPGHLSLTWQPRHLMNYADYTHKPEAPLSGAIVSWRPSSIEFMLYAVPFRPVTPEWSEMDEHTILRTTQSISSTTTWKTCIWYQYYFGWFPLHAAGTLRKYLSFGSCVKKAKEVQRLLVC